MLAKKLHHHYCYLPATRQITDYFIICVTLMSDLMLKLKINVARQYQSPPLLKAF